MAFTPQGLAEFKQRGGKVVINSEFRPLVDDVKKLRAAYERFVYADALIFLSEADRLLALGHLNNHTLNADSADLEKVRRLIKCATVVPVTQTLKIEYLPPEERVNAPPNVLGFGMLRKGKGFDNELLELARIFKHREMENRLIICGSTIDNEIINKVIGEVFGLEISKLNAMKLNSSDYTEMCDALMVIANIVRTWGLTEIKQIFDIEDDMLQQDIEDALAPVRGDVVLKPQRLKELLGVFLKLGLPEALKEPELQLLPIDLWVNVPEQFLDNIFSQVRYAYFPQQVGLSTEYSSPANAMSAGIIPAGKMDTSVPHQDLGEAAIYVENPVRLADEISRRQRDTSLDLVSLQELRRFNNRYNNPTRTAEQINNTYLQTITSDIGVIDLKRRNSKRSSAYDTSARQ
jgi:hypothetical protein